MKKINRNPSTIMVNMRINMNFRNHMESINLILMMKEQKALTQKIKENIADIAFSKSMKIMQKVNDKTAFPILIYFIYLFLHYTCN